MRASLLHSICKITQKISNQSSLTSLYRSMQINRDSVRCCSEFGNIELKTESFGIDTPCLLDTHSVVAAASTLPADSNVDLELAGNQLKWTCGTAKGHWNLVQSDHTIPVITHDNFPWVPSPELSDALRLAASACQAQAVAVGLYGITIEPDGDKLLLISSNSITLAAVRIDKTSFPCGKITLRPPVPEVIAYLVAACPNCTLDITADGIFIKGEWLLARLPFGTALQHNLRVIVENHVGMQHAAKVDASAVARFISRARMLSDRHAIFTVGLKVDAGKLVLSHASIASSTEEYFLADGLDAALNLAQIALPADMLVSALPHVDTAIFDYLGASELVLKGTQPNFTYIIGGGE